ncbi:MAG: hypothetical protein FWE91_06000 [Defluviitaleaceae bacterium]|nr:hypothetical protein [Defluviitaleaceae bacterium]MCL2835385.1 hypothetical protein [Defluviitaleaceae bacterium]
MIKKVFYKESFMIYVVITLSILCANLLIMGFSGNSPTAPNIYNSYSLQAQSWLNGRLDVAENYTHLEIAVYNGRYYISFPPLPSIILMPFSLFLSSDTPDHFITLFMAVLAGIFAYKLALNETGNKTKSLFYSLFLCIGSNFLFLSNTGYVWFMAQVFAFSFTLMSLYYARVKKRSPVNPALSLLFFCCALGCRPLNAVYLPVIFYLLYEKNTPFAEYIRKLIISAIPAIMLGFVFMLLNYLRFGDIFEFGHNYLPEFTESEHGQFSLAYLAGNFRTLWRLPDIAGGKLRFHAFNGTAFWLVSPIVITYAVTFIRRSFQTKKLNITLLLLASCLLHLLFTCAHKTMGGWHFGHRYTVDMLPVLFLGLLLQIKGLGKGYDKADIMFSIPLFVWGLGLNVIGTVFLYRGIL